MSDAEFASVRDCLAQHGEFRLAIVYGSVASGRARTDSDLDVAVLATAPLTAAARIRLIEELAVTTGRAVDLIDLANVGEPLLGQILSGGRRILGDDGEYARLVTRHLLDAADFLPYRDRILAERRREWIGK